MVYAVNTLAAVAGALAAGFVSIPLIGLERTLSLVSALLLGGGAIVIMSAGLSRKGRLAGSEPAAAGVTLLVSAPSWTASYWRAAFTSMHREIPENVEGEVAVMAGTLLDAS